MQTARAETAEQRRQWMEAHPEVHPDTSHDWMDWKIDESKRLKDPALMPAAALFGSAPIDRSGRGGSVPDGPAKLSQIKVNQTL